MNGNSPVTYHTLYDTLPRFESMIENKIENNDISNSKIDVVLIKSLLIAKHLKKVLNNNDPLLFRNKTLTNLENNIKIVERSLKNLNNSNDFTNINSRIDDIITDTSSLLNTKDSEDINNIRDTVVSFRRSLGRHKTVLTEEASNLKKESTELANLREQHMEKFNSIAREIEEKKQEIVHFKKELSEEFLDQKSELFDNLEMEINESKAKYNGVFDDLAKTLKNDFKNMIDIYDNKLESIINETIIRKDKYDKDLSAHKRSVEEIVGIISTTSISGHFKENADFNRKSKNIWQIVTISAFLLTVIFGIFAFMYDTSNTWVGLVSRGIVTTALGSLTAYAARQASKSEAEERNNRRMEIELKTLDPYIASFKNEDRIKLKEQLFPTIFGNNTASELNLNEALDVKIDNINDLLKLLSEIVGKIKS
ncbi:hypothetical protein SAMN04488134_11375 [Amphibacillus marinus]|uniref:Uncharacterized protein n=1 Tax=Amphibacillus marinus TaxID=872970 RepID=A0A1H8SRN7_9BACI|nr:hypothetical protein [Amphibacillus marinus]SEO80998.1 hypothetical protein SAMN04488134_11375 [Amphibacillus marinus]